MKNKITAIILSVLLMPPVGALGAEYAADMRADSDGNIEYTADLTDECDVYIAVYDESGALKAVRKNSSSGRLELDSGHTYKAAAYFWKRDGIEPVRLPVTAENLKASSIYLTSAKLPKAGNSGLMATDTALILPSGESIELSRTLTPSDKNASEETQRLYKYLDAVSRGGMALFGQENSISHKAGASDLSDSDVFDVTGDYPAVFGIDTLSLVGAEFSAWTCNGRYGTDFKPTPVGNVSAAAYLTNKAAESGAVITLSSHMPNFSLTKETEDPEGDETYAKYDFNVYEPSPVSDSDDVMNNIMPGGKYNDKYTAFLDMIADYAKQVNSPILFRPFHENTGSWFWWGEKFCSSETYKSVYAYTADYLRGKDVHNLLYVYSPGSEFNSSDDYLARYPGDDYTDIVGFDMYHNSPDGTKAWYGELSRKLSALSDFAKKHGKVCALTETGVSNNGAALLKSGNKDKEWFMNMLDVLSDHRAAYFMVWANWGEDSAFYTPYVKKINSDGSLYGHEMMDNFIDFYNDPRSVFASDLIKSSDRIN